MHGLYANRRLAKRRINDEFIKQEEPVSMMLAGFLLVPLLTAYIAGRALAELRAIKQIVRTVIIESILL